MEANDLPGKEVEQSNSITETSRVPPKVMDVSELTEQHLLRSFACMENHEQRKLANSFALPKVAVTKTPELNKIMAAQCNNNQALARIQTLNSNALAPLTKVLEMFNREEEDFTTEHLNQVGYAVESAITLLGNAFAQMSMLRCQKVLKEYNK